MTAAIDFIKWHRLWVAQETIILVVLCSCCLWLFILFMTIFLLSWLNIKKPFPWRITLTILLRISHASRTHPKIPLTNLTRFHFFKSRCVNFDWSMRKEMSKSASSGFPENISRSDFQELCKRIQKVLWEGRCSSVFAKEAYSGGWRHEFYALFCTLLLPSSTNKRWASDQT